MGVPPALHGANSAGYQQEILAGVQQALSNGLAQANSSSGTRAHPHVRVVHALPIFNRRLGG